MTLQLNALEQAGKIIEHAQRSVTWISVDNPVWMTLYHAGRYISEQFKGEFNAYFKSNNESEDEHGTRD